jgi:hypothetical protein
MRAIVVASLALSGALGASVFSERSASACGACVHQPPPPNPPPNQVDTQVTGHRMAFALSPQQTVLWDQISYSGNPKEFAWVLPVRKGTRVELSSDAWLAALDASTATVIEPPDIPSNCPQPSSSGGFGGGGLSDGYGSDGNGCDEFGGGCASSEAEGAFANGGGEDGGAADGGAFHGGPPPPPPVQVQTQEVVGPYDVVIVHSSQGEALGAWLVANGFEVPKTLQPVIDKYVAEGFDFVALKLAPGGNERAMQPVRVVEPGADPSLPLRMVAGGVGASVSLELWVISEGRYHPQNFPDATVDFSQLTYSVGASESNYETLATNALASGNGTGWLTEYAGYAPLQPATPNTPGLLDAYNQACMPTLGTTCDAGAAPDAAVDDAPSSDAGGEATTEGGDDAALIDAAASDAAAVSDAADAANAADAADAADDAGNAADGGTCTPTTGSQCDDLAVAFDGLHMSDVWITRLRANLPVSALSQDLILEAAPDQAPVQSLHQAQSWVGDPCTLSLIVPRSGGASANGASCALGSRRRASDSAGSPLLVVATALALSWMKRRKKREGRP